MQIIKVPSITDSYGCSFEYEGVNYKLSKMRKNYAGNCFVTNLYWGGNVIYGLVLREKINLIKAFGRVDMPSLYVIFDSEPVGEDDFPTVSFYIREDSGEGTSATIVGTRRYPWELIGKPSVVVETPEIDSLEVYDLLEAYETLAI